MLSIGTSDLSRLYQASSHNARLKADLARLTAELSSGRVADPAARLGAGLSRLSDMDRQLSLIEGYSQAAVQTAQSLRIMQITLGSVEQARQSLAGNTLQISGALGVVRISTVAESARSGFATMVTALNARVGNLTLFAGRATDGAALAPADRMLDELRVAAAGALTVEDAMAAIDAWFAPGGGFETAGYLGDGGPPLVRRVDEGVAITVPLRADDPALTALLAATATAALADDSSLQLSDEARRQLLTRAGERLLTGAEGLVQSRARLGDTEARLDEVITNQSARKTALNMMRLESLAADPFDAAAALQEAQTRLETHYALTARLSRMSLADYL